MKVALTVWGNRVFPVFDSARTMLLVNVENGAEVDKRQETLGSALHASASFVRLASRHTDLRGDFRGFFTHDRIVWNSNYSIHRR